MPSYTDNTGGLRLISRDTGTPAVDLASLELPLIVLDCVNEEVARRLQVLPLRVDQGNLFIAAAEPNDALILGEISFLSGKKIVAYAAHIGQLQVAIDQAYQAKRAGEAMWRGPKANRPAEPSGYQVVNLDQIGQPVQPASDPLEPMLRNPNVPLPQAPPAVKEPFVGEASYKSAIPTTGVRPRARPRILVVDDEPVIRKIVQNALVQRGYQVVEAGNGVEALKMVQKTEPDALLLDAMLPDVHGFDVCKRLKSSRRYQHIPIIMMTAVYKGWRMAADLREAYGVFAVIEKPFDLHDIVQKLEDALDGKPSERPNLEELSAEAQRLYQDGSAAYRRGDLDSAIVSMTGAVAIDPLSAPLRHQLGLLHAQKGNDFVAIQELEAAVDLEAERFQTLRNLAILYQRHGFRRKSCELWERALSTAPDESTRTEIKSLLVQLL